MNELNTQTPTTETLAVETPTPKAKRTRKAKATKTKSTKGKVRAPKTSTLKQGPIGSNGIGQFTAQTSELVRLAAIPVPRMVEILEKVGGQPLPEGIATRKQLIGHAVKAMGWGWHRGNVVNKAKKAEYGAHGHCDDAVARELANAVRSINPDTHADYLDLDKLKTVAKENSISLDRWMHLNIGQVRMNFGNVLRGRKERGEKVVIGSKVWNKDGEMPVQKPVKAKTKKAA